MYETRADLIDTLVPFFAVGLANNEQCLWVTSTPLSAADATSVLLERIPNVAEYLSRKQMQILDYSDWYTRTATIETDSLLKTWLEAEKQALERGFKGLRVTGDTSFLRSRESWGEFERYEARVTETFKGRRLIALCSYHLGTATAGDVLDVVRNHQFAIARRHGAWEMIENASIKVAKEQLRKANLELEQRVAARTAELEAELADARLLHDISAAFVDEDQVDRLYQKLLDAAATVMRSEYASMQSYDRERGEDGWLRLLAHRGFTPEAATFWAWVRPDSESTCGAALRTRRRVIVADVEACESMVRTDDLATYKQTGIRAVQTTPLLSRSGTLVGMISTHWNRPHEPTKRDLQMLDILARQAADLIERNKAAAALRAQTAELLSADRHKDEFLATLAHELRNPLAPLRTGLAVLKSCPPDAADRVLQMMERQLGHMVHLIDDLLEVSRVSRGMVTLNKQRVTLRTVIDTAVETSRPLLEAAQHRFDVTMPGSPLWLEADTTRVAQIIANLLNNAAKYTPKGGHVVLAVEAHDEGVQIRVTDTGIGIAPEMLPKVFDMFAQVEHSLERSGGGLGIGLSLAKRLAVMHGGSITAESEGPGKGSTFKVQLPLAAAPPAESPSPTGNEQTGALCYRILVVDDNADAAEMLAELLKNAGHITRVIHDSREVLGVALQFRPDVVFLDIGMPKMNGFDVAHLLRQQPELSSTVLVALTGWGSEQDRVKSHKAGFDLHLTKPALPEAIHELLALVANWPNESRRAAS
jgi:signal transduction histidine kinase/ActR/RegA family two-component response regulator